MKRDTQFDEKLFLRAFVEAEPALRAYARSLLPNWDAVDETMQEASVVMWKKIRDLAAEGDFLPWAKTVLRFEALKTRRRHARDRHVFCDDLVDLLAREGQDDSERFVLRQKALESCLGLLSQEHRDLVMAPYQHSGAIVKLATHTGRTVNSLYKRLARVRLGLRRCVEGKLAAPATEGGW
jgi:RNA polymerase sigma-70 factor (ECF subfamily)